MVVRGDANIIESNHFGESGLPGWSSNLGAIRLEPETVGNIVRGNIYPSHSDICDQVRDEGENDVWSSDRTFCDVWRQYPVGVSDSERKCENRVCNSDFCD